MNILILNWRDIKNPKSGGAEIVTMKHAKAWVKSGNNVDWFASEFKSSKKNESVEGVCIFRKGSSFTTFLYAPFFYFKRKDRYDLVIDQIHGLPYFTPLYVKKPIVAFIHEVAAEIWDYMYPFPLNKIGRFIESKYFFLYKNITFWTDAESTINDLVKHKISRDHCIAISCPTDIKPLSNLVQKEKRPTFIFISRLVKMKGIEDTLVAFHEILKKEKDAILWIVGDGEKKYLDFLKQKIIGLDIKKNVIFYGRVSEKKKVSLIKKAHILLHTSIKEGWGLVVIEAASQGTPSVVYNVAGLRDSVRNNITGIVVESNTPFYLAKESIALYLDKKRYRDFQLNSIDWAKSLTWKDATEKSLTLINSL